MPNSAAQAKTASSMSRSLEGSPLVRLHSCPSLLADALFPKPSAPTRLTLDEGPNNNNEDGNNDNNNNNNNNNNNSSSSSSSSSSPSNFHLAETKAGAKLTSINSVDETAFDFHFFRFLDGLIADLVRWKLAANRKKHEENSLPPKNNVKFSAPNEL